MKLNLIFFACLVFCSVTTFLAVRKYEAAVVVIAANLGGSRKMAITHIAYSKDEPMPAESMKHINVMNAVAVAKSGSEWHNGAASSTSTSTTSSSNATSVSTMSEAMGCLRQTKPDLANISYPDDALEHFYEIQKTLHKWTRYKPHKASGYRGPWIENRWISHFQKGLESNNHTLQDVFGPYVPLLIPWTDVWVWNGHEYPRELTLAMKKLLRKDVMYITVSQNADGFVGRCTEFEQIQRDYHITILSAGGYGHVPIPLLKQPEKLRSTIPMDKRKHLVSYVGSDKNAPGDMRRKMIDQNNHFYYKGKQWREIMTTSRFSLCPRGYGRTSYHLMEALQMGLIPIHVYIDQPWLPYGNLLGNLTYSVTREQLPDLVAQLEKMPDSEIAMIEEKIRDLRDNFFTFEGVLDQIGKFMLNPQASELKCQPLPSNSGSPKKSKSCTKKRRRRRRRGLIH